MKHMLDWVMGGKYYINKGFVMNKQVKINDKSEQCFGVIMTSFSSSKR